jgi:alkylation response protein AidB-like acyl-CoA dehydrogenase
MELTFGPDETMLRDTVRRWLEREYTFESRRARMQEPDGFSRATWQQFAELGVLAATLPADAGGFDAGAIGTLVIMEAFGDALVVEPFLATVVLGAGALELAGSAEQRAQLAAVGEGTRLLAFAHDEAGMRYDAARVATTAEPAGADFVLRGRKSVVLHGASADALIVSARVRDGLGLFLVERDAPGVRTERFVTPDGFAAADVTFDGARVAGANALGVPGSAGPVIEWLLDRATAAVCGEAIGVMDALLKRTISYLGTRQQFGMPLARFQALQHRIADVAIEVEQARSMALVAAQYARHEDANARRRHVSAAKARVGIAAKFVGEQAVQLHGGIGMTDELDVSHYFKRLTMIARTFGDADHHVGRYLATG